MSRSDDSLESAILAGVDGRLVDVHTQLRGTVVSYDEATHTCEVEIATKLAVPDGDGGFTFEKFANLPNVVVAWPSAGGFLLHWPLASGDSVYLTFDEIDSQQWELTGKVSEPGWLERFGLSSVLAHPYSRKTIATSGACMICPTPFAFGDPATSQFVPTDTKLQAALNELKSAISGAAVIAGDGGAAFKSNLIAALSSWPPSTASSKLKAQP